MEEKARKNKRTLVIKRWFKKNMRVGSRTFFTILGIIAGLGLGFFLTDSPFSSIVVTMAILGGVIGHIYSIKNRKRWFKRLLRRIGLYPIVGSVLYLFWLCYWMVNANIWLTEYSFLDRYLPNRVNPSEFSTSYAASSLDSFVFFILIGLVLAVISLKRPQEESLSTKVEYIFPESKDVPLNSYLQEQISALACISPITERTITIQEVSECKRFVRILIKSHSVIKNIHNNHEYINKKAQFNLGCTEPFVEKDILGEALDVSVMYRIDGTQHTKHVLDDIIRLTPDKPTYSCTFGIKLDSEQQAIYQTSGWFWQALYAEMDGKSTVSKRKAKNDEYHDRALNFNVIRYTNKQDFKIINNTDERVKVIAKVPSRTDFSGIVDPSSENQKQFCEFSAEGVTPGEKVSIYFSLEVNEDSSSAECAVT